jgi:hypothetical protein
MMSLKDYGAKVQARIKKLTEKYRKEERDREEAHYGSETSRGKQQAQDSS